MMGFLFRPSRGPGIVKLTLIATYCFVTATPAHAQFGGSCGCPVIVSDPEIYGRQGDQLTQETRIADLAAQNSTAGDAGML